MMLPATLWQHRTLWIWNASNSEQTTMQWLATNAIRLGFRAVCVKVHDGDRIFYGTQQQGGNADPRYFEVLRKAGLIVGGWGYLYGDGEDGRQVLGVEKEAQRAVERCATLELDFYVADPEMEYEFSPRDYPYAHAGNHRYGYSKRFVEAFALAAHGKLARGFPRGVASYGRASLHDVDMTPWARGSQLDGVIWRNIMQAYRNEGAALDVALCVDDALRWWDRRFIHPLLGVYPVHGQFLDPAVYASELQQARTLGFGIYSLDSCSPAQLPAYGKLANAR